jgi:protoporphyrinogen oxidase
MRALVVGTGFEGIHAAHLLARDPRVVVDMVDPSPNFGGIMASPVHRGVALDLGCQVLDNFDPAITQAIQELCQGRVRPLDLSYGSRIHGRVSTDMSVPDLSGQPPEVVDILLREVVEASGSPPAYDTLRTFCQSRWGTTAADLLETVSIKVFGMPSTELDGQTSMYVGLKRIRLGDDARSLALKEQSDALQERVAVPRTAVGTFYRDALTTFPGHNLHPAPHSFRGFCDSAREVLVRQGVTIRLDTVVSELASRQQVWVTFRSPVREVENPVPYDLVVWTGRLHALESLALGESRLSSLISPMGFHLFYHFAAAHQFSEHGYFQNYDPKPTFFRWSAMGNYTDQRTESGHSFCCTEIPDHGDHEAGSLDADIIWQDLRTSGLVTGLHDGHAHHIHAQRCVLRYLPGFTRVADQVMERLSREHPAIVFNHPGVFGRVLGASKLGGALDARMALLDV